MGKTIIRIKNSTIALQESDALLREIENFDLAKATPVDCHVFIRQLKERYGRR
jgi:hypothetical protein